MNNFGLRVPGPHECLEPPGRAAFQTLMRPRPSAGRSFADSLLDRKSRLWKSGLLWRECGVGFTCVGPRQGAVQGDRLCGGLGARRAMRRRAPSRTPLPCGGALFVLGLKRVKNAHRTHTLTVTLHTEGKVALPVHTSCNACMHGGTEIESGCTNGSDPAGACENRMCASHPKGRRTRSGKSTGHTFFNFICSSCRHNSRAFPLRAWTGLTRRGGTSRPIEKGT